MGLACLLAVSAGSAPFMEWTGMTVYAADAANGKCGEDLTWTLDDGTLTISGTGEMENYASESKVPWYSSRTSIKTVSIEEGVTSIGNYAFRACSSLSSITIPNNVTSIGVYAFRSCSNLSSITIPNNVTSIGALTFSGCSNLSSIKIPDSVTSIGMYAFSGCSSLSSITIPNSVTSIDAYTFQGCSNLSSVIYHGTKTQWDKISNSFPSNLTVIWHTHTADSIWKSDQEHHWHQCTDSECPARDNYLQDDYAEHTWAEGKCTECGYDACNHIDSAGKSTLVKTEKKEPTCTESGNIEYWTCSVCHLKLKDAKGTIKLEDSGVVSQASGHSYPTDPTQKDWKKNETSHWLECARGSDCSDLADNKKDEAVHHFEGDICTVCGYERAHVHNLEPVESVEATCTTAGNKTYYKCSGCDSLFASKLGSIPVSYAELTVPATGHKYDGYLQDAEGHWQQCSVCGEATAKESHDFSGNTCDTCGYQKPAEAETETNTETNTDSNANTSTYSSSHHDDDSTDVTDNSQKGRWVQDEKGWYFRRNDGSYPKSGWSKLYWLGKEYWYYFDENGYMKLGWMDVNGNRYYLNPVIGTNSGKMLTGWQLIDQKWYYFSTEQGAKEGSLLRNTVTPDHYPVDQDGVWKQ